MLPGSREAALQHRQKKRAKLAAQKAYMLALEGVEALGLTPPDRQFLFRQRPVTVDNEGRVVLLVGCGDHLATARAHPAIAKLARTLRDKGLATGIDYELAAQPTRTVADATHTLPAKPPGRQAILYIPQFLVCHTLPHRPLKDKAEFTRVNGATRLTTLAPSRPGLPYGVYPRLILIHVATSAVRSRLRHLVLGQTVTAFLRRMDISKEGGKNGSSTRARDQIERLRQTTFTYRDFNGRDTANIPIFDKAKEETANRLKIVLGETFYKLATEHPVPLDEAIVRQLRRSPLALDLYAWLTYRVTTLKRETRVPWAGLMAQMGAGYKHQRQFRWKLKQSLAAVTNAWPGLRAEPQKAGLLIRPGPPSVLAWAIRQQSNGR